MTSARHPRHLLIFEPEHRGHPLEWLQHFIRHVAAAQPAIKLSLAVAPELAAELQRTGDEHEAVDVRVIPLPEEERSQCNQALLPLAAFARWRAMRRLLRATAADHGHFLTVDFMSLPLGLGLRLGCPISGILFRPSVHYAEMMANVPTPRERARDLRKRILYRRMLQHPELTTVFSLDPYFVPYAAKAYGNAGKVRWLPDPVPPTVAPAAEEVELAARYPPGRIAFLLFGVLTERKGIIMLLEALSRLSPDTASRVAVLAAGRVDPPIAAEAQRLAHALAIRKSAPWFHLEDRHLTVGEIEALLARADVVLAPYQRFVGSSGVLLWAAARGNPILVQDYGLLGRFARDHKLGLAVDTANPETLAAGIEMMARDDRDRYSDPRGMATFVEARSPKVFAGEIIACALKATVAEQTGQDGLILSQED